MMLLLLLSVVGRASGFEVLVIEHTGKQAHWDGEKIVYPVGYENFDHKLTFLYAKESGIYSDYCTPTLAHRGTVPL